MTKILTSNNLSNATIFIAVVLILLSCWEMLRNKKGKGIKRITTIGWFLIVFAIFSGIVSYLSRKVDTKEKVVADSLAVKKSDSLRKKDKEFFKNDVDSALKNYGLQLKHVTTNNIIISDTSKYVLPMLDLPVFIDKENPTITLNDNLDSLNYVFRIKCVNKGIAYNLRDRLMFFRIKDGKFGYLPGFKRFIPEYEKLYGDKQLELAGQQFIKNLASQTNVTKDTLYFYIKILYSGKPNTDRVDGIFRSFSRFTITQPVKSKTDLSPNSEVLDIEYQKIKKEFIAKSIW